jgi:HEAT repeat protein
MADKAKFLSDIRRDSADVRFAAWRTAGEQDASVIADLASIAGSTSQGVQKAALEAMATLTHSVGKETANPKRPSVAAELAKVAAANSRPLPVRAHSLRLLSLLGGDDVVPAVAKLLADREVREEAIFCLERIPGDTSINAIAAAYANVPSDFKGRILAALGHRRAQAGVGLAVAAMKSPDKALAMSSARAFGRIGVKPATTVQWPAAEGLSAWQTIEHQDSRFRYAEAQVAQGNQSEAMVIYKQALDHPAEHIQCAAIVGISRMGTAEAAATIFPKLKSPDRTVRITAEQAWKRMAGTEAAKASHA